MRVTSYFNSPESEPSDCGQAIRGSNLSLRHKFGVYLGLTGLGLMGVADAQAQGNPVSHDNGVENMNDPMYSAQKLNAGQTVCIDTNAEQGDLVGVTATVTEPSSAGYVNVSSRESSANDGWRKTSNLNYVAGQTIANSMGVVAGPNGEVCATPMTPTHLILDVAGATDASVVTAENPDGSPSRSLDTRNANDQTRGQKLNAGQTVCIDTNAEQGDLVGVTATVTEPSSAGYVNVSSRESSANDGWRKTSNLNYVAGQTIANSMGVVAGPNGEVCATPMTPTHLILDVAGATDASVVTAENPDGSPSRSLDTRNANDQTRGQKLNAGQTVCIDTNAEQGDLVGVTATVTEPSSAGYVNVSSRESSANDGWRKTSNLNYVAGQTIANSMGVVAGPNGEVCATPMTPTHLILDVAGATDASVVTAENPDGSPSRSLDTRIDKNDDPNNGVSLIDSAGQPIVVDRQITASCVTNISSPTYPIKRVEFHVADIPAGFTLLHETVQLTSISGNGGMANHNTDGSVSYSANFFPTSSTLESVDSVAGYTTLWLVEVGKPIAVDRRGLAFSKFIFSIACSTVL